MIEATKKLPWLAIVVGALSTVIGIILTGMNARSTADESGVYLILGGVLTAFGPVVLSHAISKQLGRREAREELESQIDSISMNLGQSVIALDNALRRNAAHVDDARVTLSIANAVVSNIEVQISQLQKLLGTPFSSDSILTTKRQLVTLAGSLSKAVEGDDPDALREASRDIQKVIRRLVKPVIEGGDLEDVRCPTCGTTIPVALPQVPGATKHPTCVKCGGTFAAHRDRNGVVFVRISSTQPAPAGADAPERSTTERSATSAPDTEPNNLPTEPVPAPRPSQVTAPCPTCANTVKFWHDGKSALTVICLECDTAIQVGSDSVVVSSDQYTRRTASIQRAATSGFIALCPECEESRRCSIRKGRDFFGLCATDKLTLVIPAAAAEEYSARTVTVPEP